MNTCCSYCHWLRMTYGTCSYVVFFEYQFYRQLREILFMYNTLYTTCLSHQGSFPFGILPFHVQAYCIRLSYQCWSICLWTKRIKKPVQDVYLKIYPVYIENTCMAGVWMDYMYGESTCVCACFLRVLQSLTSHLQLYRAEYYVVIYTHNILISSSI